MSVPTTTFRLELREDDAASQVLEVTNLTTGESQNTQDLPSGLPYYLAVETDPEESAALRITVIDSEEAAFDPSRVTDCNVLSVDGSITDEVLGPMDETHLLLTVTNTSTYYLAKRICVSARLDTSQLGEDQTVPDGSLIMELAPGDQFIPCLEPQASAVLEFMVFTRGTETGTYPVEVHLDYQIVYWDGRDAETDTTVEVVVGQRSSGACNGTTTTSSASERKRQQASTFLSSRRMAMANHVQKGGPSSGKGGGGGKYRQLDWCSTSCKTPAGDIKVDYKLVRGYMGNKDVSQCSCIYGANMEGVHECHFEPDDTATMLVKVHNLTPYDLKNVQARSVELYRKTDEGDVLMTETHRDDNLVFEIVPCDRYFGDIPRQGCESDNWAQKEFILVARFTYPGNYDVKMEFDYEIHHMCVPAVLPLQVKGD